MHKVKWGTDIIPEKLQLGLRLNFRDVSQYGDLHFGWIHFASLKVNLWDGDGVLIAVIGSQDAGRVWEVSDNVSKMTNQKQIMFLTSNLSQCKPSSGHLPATGCYKIRQRDSDNGDSKLQHDYE